MRGLKRTISKLSFITNRVRQLLLLRKYKASPIMQHGVDSTKTVWDPLKIFHCPAQYEYAVVILNRPLKWKHDILFRLWENAQINVTVDGGTHKWLHYLKDRGIDLLSGKYDKYVPNLITGDMDSCSSIILDKLKSMGSMIIETPDQDHSDYTKALIQLGQYAKAENINLNAVYVFVDSSGRFDHIIGNINTLHKSNELIGDRQVIQVASNSLIWILKPGFHSIVIPNILVQNNSWCGLLPIGAPVNSITTTGLKWNLNNATMQFGGLISSSNTYDNCSEVTVSTDSPVIWTMGIEPVIESMNNYEIQSSHTR
ncbi:thiamine pyrophosphokinase 1 isoform X1 [Andrena cerasifolii]|uniref:thiamine pyrophosphokinase 1 isoform X1 n=1 Tax=Andrena cerasifolii TaxID=2819439 RepID=UPI004038199A